MLRVLDFDRDAFRTPSSAFGLILPARTKRFSLQLQLSLSVWSGLVLSAQVDFVPWQAVGCVAPMTYFTKVYPSFLFEITFATR